MVRAVAPPGGWIVSVQTITTMASATAAAIEYHSTPRRITHMAPMKAENRCPKNTFFGLDSGPSGTAKIRTAVAPNDVTR